MKYYFEESTNKIVRGRRETAIVSTVNEDIMQTKGDDITCPVTPLYHKWETTKPLHEDQEQKLLSKIVQQVVKSAYSRWSSWSVPYSDWKDKRLRNVKTEKVCVFDHNIVD